MLKVTPLILTLTCWILLLCRIIQDRNNRTAFNILWLIPLFGTFYAIEFAQLINRNWRVPYRDIARLLLFAVSILGVTCLYHFNILIPEELWIRRGMPERP